MSRIVLITAALLVVLCAGSIGALAFADGSASEQLPQGARVGGVSVGGLTREEATKRAQDGVRSLIARPAYLQLGEKRYTLTPSEAGVRVDVETAVERAYVEGRQGSFISRGWRKLTGAKLDQDVPVKAVADRLAVRRFVERIAKEQARKPVDSAMTITLTSVSVSHSRPGRRLAARDALVARLMRRMTSSTDERTLRAKTVKVPPKVNANAVWDAQPIAVTVSRDGKQARVFRRGNLVKTYTVAVGTAEYPTPTGRYVVQTMQKNPAWNVPQSEWAGALAGQTIPSGDPRNPLVARWIGINGSVGFHGTASSGSLGTAASHGCIRMAPADVIDLYERVSTGTPVLVA
ncbi:MAG: L,D-transpeptidase/peptidoglycan binding protein [Actinobacteria bacterium]|nr:L,D-transpeptidase/peptidoglycan binding protein [Actinomycetota bacterium]